jgi:3-phosphoshikimate 1-carboxyvinyltransferase
LAIELCDRPVTPFFTAISFSASSRIRNLRYIKFMPHDSKADSQQDGSNVIVRPAREVRGVIRIPGDKSISHRYAMLAAIAEGTSRFQNFSAARDCASTLDCVAKLGSEWKPLQSEDGDGEIGDGTIGGGAVEVRGIGSQLKAPTEALDCGNSGSTMRMLSGILAGQPFTSQLFGDESLSRRPMARIIKPLLEMGAKIEATHSGRPPLKIHGGPLKPIHYKPEVASAQVKSCVLFAGLFADGETIVEEPIRTRDHGEIALRAFGAEVERKGNASRILGGQQLRAIEAHVPGDLSSAAFFLCAAALFPESQITLPGILMNPTRARLLDILLQMGLKVSVAHLEEHQGELVGTIEARGAAWKGTVITGADTAALIDEIPVLAAVAPYSEGGLEVRDAKELRVKESDRIAAVATNLRKMGAEVEERPDGMRIPGAQHLHGAELDSFGDHRIAMAFAVAALRAEGETIIYGADAAGVSYPTFFEELRKIAE